MTQQDQPPRDLPQATPYDAILLLSFGGPEGVEDVMPFLENVARGRNIPRARLEEVAEHYYHFGGVSPINQQNRALIAALEQELQEHGPRLPIYFGNRNWHPLLPDTLARMAQDGVRRALAFVTSAFSSYSSCRQYLEDIQRARAEVGPHAPQVDKIRPFFNHPGFIQANAAMVQDALAQLPPEKRAEAHIAFTAHSIPLSLARTSAYEAQLQESARLVAQEVGAERWSLVYQSRSGPPHQPWLEPDICDHLEALHGQGIRAVVVAPIGFLSDHLEVLFDLDTEAQGVAERLGMAMVRAATVGTHPAFVRMVRELIRERAEGAPVQAVGRMAPCPHVCPPDCCPAPVRRGHPGARPGEPARG